MKRLIYCLLILAVIWNGCTDEEIVSNKSSVGKEVWMNIPFGAQDNGEVKVTTRATIGVVPESRVYNLFVYLFVGGKRVYAHYFDNENMMVTKEDAIGAEVNCWYVENQTDANGQTKGTIRAKAPSFINGTMYVIANIDADMVNISPEKLNYLHEESEIESLAATLNQEITSRNGYFPMSAKLEGISVSEENGTFTPANQFPIQLKRLDAKVEVKVRVASGNEISDTANGITTTQALREFVPESWRVVNLPKGTYAIGREDADYEVAGYFDTEPVAFETTGSEEFTYKDANGVDKTVTGDVDGFSFYMLENREAMKKTVDGNYHLRDMRTKHPTTGKYMEEGDKWEYAPEKGTYLEIKGDILMDVDVTNEKKQQLTAQVTYYIHLGNINKSLDDYSIQRNTHYTYTITIKGVTKIELEVTSSAENDPTKVKEEESGATGMVYVAKEATYTFDAHYSQRVFCFDAAFVNPETVTWYVKTPFGKEGSPNKVDDTEVPSGMDYKWVEFMVNETDETTGAYSRNNQAYPGYKNNPNNEKSKNLMDVVEFTKYIKDQKRNLERGLPHDFKEEIDTAYPEGKQERKRIWITVFVNEYYYEKDPITGEAREGLWKEFVNQPNRLMHILSDSRESLDGESSSTGSVITIRQRSIQTPYNINKASLTNGWGCEVVDETAGRGLFFYSSKEKMGTENDNDNYTNSVTFNNSEFNGKYNTAILWGVLTNSSSPSFEGGDWNNFLDYSRPNDYINEDGLQTDFLLDDYAVLRYTPIMRNRDNNGNGKIDADEIRWYIASIDQLYGLYFGQLGLSSDAILYSAENASQKGNYDSSHPFAGAHKWRNHIVSSTSTGGPPVTLWGEEGISVSNYGNRYKKPAPYSVRCVRNLGMDYASEEEARNALLDKEAISIKLVNVIAPESITKNATYKFDLTNINDKSLRFYTTRELEPGNEHSEMSRLYYGFQTGAMTETGLYQSNGSGLYYDLIAGKSPCTEEWRVPNVREGALMSLYCSRSWWDGNITVSSFYSNGTSPWGNGNDTQSPSWQFNYKYASIGTSGVNRTRMVQDWYPE